MLNRGYKVSIYEKIVLLDYKLKTMDNVKMLHKISILRVKELDKLSSES